MGPENFWWFAGVHIAALLLHLINGIIGVLLISSTGDYRSQLTTTGLSFDPAAGGNAICPSRATNRPQTAQFIQQKCVLEVSGLWILIFTEWFTALAHVWYLLNISFLGWDDWWRRLAHLGRWVEYSISATSLSLANATGVGFSDFSAVINLAISLFVVQFGGYALEIGVNENSRHLSPLAGWIAFALASLLQAQSFIAVQVQVQSMDSGKPPGSPAKDFDGFQEVAAVYIASYLLFPALLVAYALPKTFGWSWTPHYEFIEYLFTIAGALVKTTIFWMIFATVSELFAYYGFSNELGISWRAVRISAMVIGSALFITGSIVGGLFMKRRAKKEKSEEERLSSPAIRTTMSL